MIGHVMDQQQQINKACLNCPRCDSSNTKFCYYNNYSLSQPRYFCKACIRYWTSGGSLRNVPIGGGGGKISNAKRACKSRVMRQPPQPSYLSSSKQVSKIPTSTIPAAIQGASNDDVLALSSYKDMMMHQQLQLSNVVYADMYNNTIININHTQPDSLFLPSFNYCLQNVNDSHSPSASRNHAGQLLERVLVLPFQTSQQQLTSTIANGHHNNNNKDPWNSNHDP